MPGRLSSGDRFPVDLEQATGIDDRVTREVLKEIGRDPKAGSGSQGIESLAADFGRSTPALWLPSFSGWGSVAAVIVAKSVNGGHTRDQWTSREKFNISEFRLTSGQIQEQLGKAS